MPNYNDKNQILCLGGCPHFHTSESPCRHLLAGEPCPTRPEPPTASTASTADDFAAAHDLDLLKPCTNFYCADYQEGAVSNCGSEKTGPERCVTFKMDNP